MRTLYKLTSEWNPPPELDLLQQGSDLGTQGDACYL